jgi:hypothetical protein
MPARNSDSCTLLIAAGARRRRPASESPVSELQSEDGATCRSGTRASRAAYAAHNNRRRRTVRVLPPNCSFNCAVADKAARLAWRISGSHRLNVRLLCRTTDRREDRLHRTRHQRRRRMFPEGMLRRIADADLHRLRDKPFFGDRHRLRFRRNHQLAGRLARLTAYDAHLGARGLRFEPQGLH